MTTVLSLVLAVSLPAFATQTPARDPKAEAHVVEWLKAAREQAPSVEALVAPKETSKAPRVVIVGRAYLGTNELANFERNVVEALPTLDVLALDIGWSAGEALTQWVSTGTGDLDLLLSESGTFGWSRTEERALIEGLHKRANKPAVVGIATGDPKAPCAAVLAFLGKVYPESLQRSELLLQPLRSDGRNGEPRYYQLSDAERGMLRLGIEEVLNVIRDQVEPMTKKSSPADYARALNAANALLQYEDVVRFEREGGERDPRGRIMADNTTRVLSALPATAHLVALVSDRDLARASDPDSFVAQFERASGQKSLCIGTVCARGSFRAIDPNNTAPGPRLPRDVEFSHGDLTTLETLLVAGLGSPGFIDFATAGPDAAVTAWLVGNGTLRSARAACGGASETAWDHDVLCDFDALAVIADVHAARDVSATAR